MRIALAIERFSVHAGGAEAYAVQLAQTLVAQGWDVHLYGHSWDGDPANAVFHPITQLPKWIPPSVRIVHFALIHRRLVASEDFDVIVGFGNTLTMNVYQSHGGVHYLSNIRKLRALDNSFVRSLKALLLFLTPKYHARAWIESAAFRTNQPPIIVAISDMVKDDMAKYFRVARERIRLVYNGIDTTRFSRSESGDRTELRRGLDLGDRVTFLFMAYDFRKKGVKYLVEAAGKLRERVGRDRFAVLIVGGPPSPALRSQVDSLNLEEVVSFQGPTKEPETFYQASDVFILPTFYDACSLVVFEAMAAGVPAITTVFNGAAGIIEDGVTGIVLNDPADTDEMAAAMERFLDPSFRSAASTAARKTASRYTLEINHQQMIDIFTEVAAHKASVS
jgi:UDP-glucose:(heptosyl)LPS alpha-1,3-glucosyltransferase